MKIHVINFHQSTHAGSVYFTTYMYVHVVHTYIQYIKNSLKLIISIMHVTLLEEKIPHLTQIHNTYIQVIAETLIYITYIRYVPMQ